MNIKFHKKVFMGLLLVLSIDGLAESYHDDWSSPSKIVAAVYESLSAGPHQQRDWQRFRQLFAPHSRFSMSLNDTGQLGLSSYTVDEMIALTDQYYLSTGFHEIETAQRVAIHGQMASVYSDIEVKYTLSDKAPVMRGLNHFQLLNDGQRWWIVSNISTVFK